LGDGDYFDFRNSNFFGPVTGKAGDRHRAASPTALSTLPAAPADFTGRAEEAARLLGVLAPEAGEGSAPVAAVAGLGGVGKTALALHVAHTARERGWFPGGSLFVDLRGYDEAPLSADQAVLSLLRALGVPDGDLPPTAAEQYASYRSVLAGCDPVLIILDNVCDAAQIAPLLPGEGAGHRVLVTSREVQDSLPVRQFTVEALSPGDARTLMDRSLGRRDPDDHRVADEPEAIRQLAELCGHLPLALLIASALLSRRRQRPVATLTAELKAATDRVHALRARGVDQYGKELALRPVFDVMYARQEPELARVFRLLGQAPGDSIGIGPAVNLTSLLPERLQPLLDDLTAASLLTAFPGGLRWQMHDLVRVYARAVVAEDPALCEEAAEARQRLLAYYLQGALSAKAHIQWRPDDIPSVFEGGRDHAVNWLESERTGLLAAARWTDTTDIRQTRGAVSLALSLDSYLAHRRAYDDWLTLTLNTCNVVARIDEPAAEAMAHGQLGLALHGLRRFEEAVDAHRHTRRLHERRGERDGEAKVCNNLGLSLRALRRHGEAIDAYTDSLRIYQELGELHSAAVVRSNIAVVLDEWGRLDEALDELEQALVTHMDLHDRTNEAQVRNSLGIVLRRLGRPEESVSALTRSLGLCAELGEWHGRAKAWNNLGLALRDLGRWEDSLAAHTRARDWYEFLGDGHAEASAWSNLGHTLLDLHRGEEALSAARRALDLYEAFEDWHHSGIALQNMAVIHQEGNHTEDARTAWLAAAEAYERAGAPQQAAAARENARASGAQGLPLTRPAH
jgi:tetratricopeptide (TPR) repeat protein